MKFKAVVFDMDGVMFDTESVCMKSWDTVGEEMGIGKAGYMVYKTLGMTAQAAINILQNEFGKDLTQSFLSKKAENIHINISMISAYPKNLFFTKHLNILKKKDISLQWLLQQAVTAFFII